MNFPKLILIILSMLIIAGCTTTTKKLTLTEPHVDQSVQYAKARDAFNQKNYPQAAILLKPLAEQGNAEAQYALGYMYHNGLGVPRNYKLAIQWMSAASAKGNKKATEALHRISVLNSETTSSTPQEPEQTPAAVSKSITDEQQEAQQKIAPEPVKTPSAIPAETTVAPVSTTEPESTQAKPSTSESAPTPTPAESPETATRPVPDEKRVTLTSDEQWIMDQPDTNFTIQLMATGNEVALKRFIKIHDLHNSTVYYRTQRDGKDWFTLIQGSFASPQQVNEAIKELSPALQTAKPWPKVIGDIKKALATR